MVRKIILHVGMHKTGSTAIQNAFFGYSNERVRYANFEDPNHSLLLYPIFCSNPHGYHLFRSCGMGEADIVARISLLKDTLNAIVSLDDRDLLISGEDISSLSRDELVEVDRYFASFKRTVVVHAYVRKPGELAPSILSEKIKQGYSKDTFDKIYYGDIFEKFFEIFGSRFNLRLYERDGFKGRDVVRDFSDWLNVECPNKNFLDTNRSISTNALKIIYRLNKTLNTFQNETFLRARMSMIEFLSRAFPGEIHLDDECLRLFYSNGDINHFRTLSDIDFPLHFDERCFSVKDWSKDLDFFDIKFHYPSGCCTALVSQFSPSDSVDFYILKLYLFFLEKAGCNVFPFSPLKYLERNDDVARSGINPYIHYVNFGIAENRVKG